MRVGKDEEEKTVGIARQDDILIYIPSTFHRVRISQTIDKNKTHNIILRNVTLYDIMCLGY